MNAGMEAAVQRYFHDILGVLPNLRPWPGQRKLPYFLQEAYDLRELRLWDRPLLLAIDRQKGKPGLANARGHLDKSGRLRGTQSFTSPQCWLPTRGGI